MCFNRIKVKCKLLCLAFDGVSMSVLIESKWNVNYEDIVYFAASLRVLIESKWNVNLPARSRYSIPAMF